MELPASWDVKDVKTFAIPKSWLKFHQNYSHNIQKQLRDLLWKLILAIYTYRFHQTQPLQIFPCIFFFLNILMPQYKHVSCNSVLSATMEHLL